MAILTSNRRKELQRLFNSINSSNSKADNVYVVDNEINPETKKMVENNGFVYIEGDNNLCAISRNKALEVMTEDIVLMVDDDAMVSRDWRNELEKWFADEKVGAIGQLAYYREGWIDFNPNVKIGEECDFLTGFIWAFRIKPNWRYDEKLAPMWREESDLQLQIKYDGYKLYRCNSLGGHASSRTETDWDLIGKNTKYMIEKWQDKF